MPYVELHCHSSFSFLDGASHPIELAHAAAEHGHSALAITDHDGLHGAMELAQAAKPLGLRTIVGAELTLDEYNKAAAGFRPATTQEPYRYLDDEWIKYHWRSEQADELYRQAQQHSRNLAGRGAGLRRADIEALRRVAEAPGAGGMV